jgi:hypothetical protein
MYLNLREVRSVVIRLRLMNSNNLMDKLKTIALALFDKSRLEMIRYYVVNNMSPSEIARITYYKTKDVRIKIQHTLKLVDVDMIKNDMIYKRLMSLEDVYDYRNNKCLLCGKRKHYGEMMNHLLSSHKEYLEIKMIEVLGV